MYDNLHSCSERIKITVFNSRCGSNVSCIMTTSIHAANEVLIVYIPRFGKNNQKKTVKLFNSPEITVEVSVALITSFLLN